MKRKPSGDCFWNCFGKPARRRATPPALRPRTLTGRPGRFPISGRRPARWRSSPSARHWKRCCSSCRRPAHSSRSCPRFSESDRASRFRRRCHKAGVSGVTLHSYRYAWAERAKVVGMPERFAQAALGHNSKAIHRAYAKKAVIIAPTLEDYERKAAALPPGGCGLKIKRRLSLSAQPLFCLFWGLTPSPSPAPEAWPLDSSPARAGRIAGARLSARRKG